VRAQTLLSAFGREVCVLGLEGALVPQSQQGCHKGIPHRVLGELTDHAGPVRAHGFATSALGLRASAPGLPTSARDCPHLRRDCAGAASASTTSPVLSSRKRSLRHTRLRASER
jgi:hypothetical protein